MSVFFGLEGCKRVDSRPAVAISLRRRDLGARESSIVMVGGDASAARPEELRGRESVEEGIG